MTKRVLLLFLCVVVLGAQTQAVLTNETIIKMVQAGVPTPTIIRTIQSSERVDFRFLPSDLQAFAYYKVPDDVFKAMAEKDKSRPTASPVPSANSVVTPPPSEPPKPVAGKINDAAEKANDTVTITSLPDGATVEWNRKAIGTTPLTYKVGEYAFNARKTSLFSKRLQQPVALRVSKEGYVTREITITQQMFWQSLNGKNRFSYHVITSNSFQIDLDKVSSVPAALTNADIIKLKAAGFGDDLIIDRINNNPAAFRLEYDDLVELHKADISDAIIQAMLHAK